MKPYAESCDHNRGPILDVIRPLFADSAHVLEIGSGTGQHAVFFAGKLPHLTWYASDLARDLAQSSAIILWEKALNAASQNDLQVAKTKQNWHWLTGLSPCTGLFHLFAELVKYLDHLTDQFLVIVFATNGLGHAAPQVILKDHG